MTTRDELSESIAQNRRYLKHATKALDEVRSMIANNDLDGAVPHNPQVGLQVKADSRNESNLGLYKRQHNGKGWKKLSV